MGLGFTSADTTNTASTNNHEQEIIAMFRRVPKDKHLKLSTHMHSVLFWIVIGMH